MDGKPIGDKVRLVEMVETSTQILHGELRKSQKWSEVQARFKGRRG